VNPLFRDRFGKLVDRQLDLFGSDNAELLDRIAAARRAYHEAARDEAEERFGDYSDLVTEGTEMLVRLRETYAATLDESVAAAYEAAFNVAVRRRFGDMALELDDDL